MHDYDAMLLQSEVVEFQSTKQYQYSQKPNLHAIRTLCIEAEKHLPGTGIHQYPPVLHHNGPARIFCHLTHIVAYQDYRFPCFVQHLHPGQELVQVSPVLPDSKFVQHDGTAQEEQKHFGFLDDRMVEMPEDQNIHIHLFCQITQAVRMV